MESFKNANDELLIELYLQAIEASKKVEVDPAFIDLLHAEVYKRKLDEKLLCASGVPL